MKVGERGIAVSKPLTMPHLYWRRDGGCAILLSHDRRRRVYRNLFVRAAGDVLIFYQCDDGGRTKLGEDAPDDIMDLDWRSE